MDGPAPRHQGGGRSTASEGWTADSSPKSAATSAMCARDAAGAKTGARDRARPAIMRSAQLSARNFTPVRAHGAWQQGREGASHRGVTLVRDTAERASSEEMLFRRQDFFCFKTPVLSVRIIHSLSKYSIGVVPHNYNGERGLFLPCRRRIHGERAQKMESSCRQTLRRPLCCFEPLYDRPSPAQLHGNDLIYPHVVPILTHTPLSPTIPRARVRANGCVVAAHHHREKAPSLPRAVRPCFPPL